MAKAPTTQVKTLATERATKAINTAVDTLVKVSTSTQTALEKVVETTVKQLTAEVDDASATLQHLTNEIEDKQAALASLEGEFANKLDEAQYKLRLDVRDNENQVLRDLLQKNDLTALATSKYAETVRELEQAKADNSEAIREAVNESVEKAEAEALAERKSLSSEYEVKVAQYTAQAKSDATTIQLLKAQLEQARADLASEREARIETEKYRSQASGVTVNTTK